MARNIGYGYGYKEMGERQEIEKKEARMAMKGQRGWKFAKTMGKL